jgi:hypothetical protein
MSLQMDELMGRAMRAYFMAAAREGYRAEQPSAAGSGEEEIDGKQYVVLRNARGTIAVYRVRNDGMLKRLKRWPNAIDERR